MLFPTDRCGFCQTANSWQTICHVTTQIITHTMPMELLLSLVLPRIFADTVKILSSIPYFPAQLDEREYRGVPFICNSQWPVDYTFCYIRMPEPP